MYAVVALTSNVIGTWFVSPETTTVVLVAPTSSLRKWPFSVQVTSYPVIALPPSLVLGRETEALASPTLGGNARTARTQPTAAQRAAALRLAAEQIGTTPSRLIVLSLTSLDLGRGTAVVGTVNARGSGSPQGGRSLFFVAEPAASGFALSLGTEQTITIGDPVDQVNEYLVDAIDVGNGKVGLVTRLAGYDDHSFVIYTRAGNRWSPMYVGGSAVH